jgi:hypothetical protein
MLELGPEKVFDIPLAEKEIEFLDIVWPVIPYQCLLPSHVLDAGTKCLFYAEYRVFLFQEPVHVWLGPLANLPEGMVKQL